eukprot:993233-Lingulodinium_polyedra.AAC.1
MKAAPPQPLACALLGLAIGPATEALRRWLQVKATAGQALAEAASVALQPWPAAPWEQEHP